MQSVLRGIPASPGIVVGPVHLLRWEVPEVRPRIIADAEVPAEIERFHGALEKARERLRLLRKRAEAQVGPEEAAIFDVQLSILDDRELANSAIALIRQNLGAEKAFDIVLLEWRQHFARHAAPMLREKVGDLMDVQIRVLSILLGLPDHDPVDVPRGANAILVTHDLTPSLTMQLDRECISAIVTEAGTATAHVAILARSLGLPAIVGVRNALNALSGGETAILDGLEGTLIVAPTELEIIEAQNRLAEEEGRADVLREVAQSEAITIDGARLVVRANVDIPDEAEVGARSGAQGVGLMRTEFLVVGRASMPDEDEQYKAYKRVITAFQGQTVVIRTFDIGGDKLAPDTHHEENPFLGWRGIRVLLDRPDIFLAQLRALLRASARKNVRIMFPMICTIEEVHRAREMVHQAQHDLKAAGVPFDPKMKIGVMIEVPSAALMAEQIAAEVDFLSIGTNDLTQYMMAVDRGNDSVASLYQPFNPAVVRTIHYVVEAAHRKHKWVGICGEMAGDPVATVLFVGLGVDELSVIPPVLPEIKKIIRSIRQRDAHRIAEKVLMMSSEREIREYLSSITRTRVPEIPLEEE